jgi:hypothetical protein
MLPDGTLVSDMYYNFYLVKNNKIAKDSTATKAKENISKYLDSY